MTMTKSTLITPPSLLDAVGPAPLAAPGLLSSLNGAVSHAAEGKQTRPAFRFIAIPLILIGLLAIATAMIAGNSATSFRPLVSSIPAPAAEFALKPGASAEGKPHVAASEVAPAQAATIINDPAITVEKQTAAPVTSSANLLHDRLSAALTSSRPERAGAATEVTTTGKVKSVNTKPVANKTKVARTDSEDRDVRLLTALIATSKDIPVRKEGHANAASRIPANKNAKAKDASRNQDIVERKSGDSTASLLMRCKKLGLVEGELCRWRICSERWDSDPACKASSQSKTSAADISNQ